MYRVMITGSTGFVGRHVLAAALEENWDITVLGRRPVTDKQVKFIPWDLAAPNRIETLPCDALIHIAADMRPERETISLADEVEASRALFDAVPKTALVVFLSSQASQPAAPTRYGQVKYQIEQLVHARGGIVIRPGMVYSAIQGHDLHSRLRGLVRRLPILPDIRPAPIMQPIHVRDLSRAIARCASGTVPARMYCIAQSEDLGFTEYLELIGRLQVGRWLPRIPVPRSLVMMALPLTIPVLRLLPFNIDPTSIRSLLSSQHLDTAADLEALGVTVRPFRDGLRPAGNADTRELIMEGYALLAYLLGRTPPGNLVKRYVLAVRQQVQHEPLRLRMPFIWWPRLIRLVEGKNLLSASPDAELEYRLEIAVRILESSVIGAHACLQTRPMSMIKAAFGIAWHVGGDALWQLIGAFVRLRTRDSG